MMAYYEIEEEAPGHPKIRDLAFILGVDRPTAIGLCVTLWTKAFRIMKDGYITKIRPKELAEELGWRKSPEKLIAALKEARLVDPDGKIHNWEKHGLRQILKLEASRESGKRGSQKRWNQPADPSRVLDRDPNRDPNRVPIKGGYKGTPVDPLYSSDRPSGEAKASLPTEPAAPHAPAPMHVREENHGGDPVAQVVLSLNLADPLAYIRGLDYAIERGGEALHADWHAIPAAARARWLDAAIGLARAADPKKATRPEYVAGILKRALQTGTPPWLERTVTPESSQGAEAALSQTDHLAPNGKPKGHIADPVHFGIVLDKHNPGAAWWDNWDAACSAWPEVLAKHPAVAKAHPEAFARA